MFIVYYIEPTNHKGYTFTLNAIEYELMQLRIDRRVRAGVPVTPMSVLMVPGE